MQKIFSITGNNAGESALCGNVLLHLQYALGLAVDINPLYNPYIKEVDGKTIIEPVTAGAYTDRNAHFNYKIDENDLAYKLFTEHGFEWGGSWQERKDYQHCEIPTPVIEKLYKQK